MKLNNFFFPLFAVLLFACKSRFVPTSHTQNVYSIQANEAGDTLSALGVYFKPLRDSLTNIMNVSIGNAQDDFIKERPGGSLGNLITDAIYAQATSNLPMQGVIYNYGGMRIPEIKKGNIPLGKVYELLPFDNELVVVSIKGSVLMSWLTSIGNAGGWPIFMDSTIITKKVIQANGLVKHMPAMISLDTNMQPRFKHDTVIAERLDDNKELHIDYFNIDKDATYHIATNDYLANGGDNCGFLKEQKCLHSGQLIRDVVINYITQRKHIQADTTKRLLIPVTIKKEK